MNLHLEGYRGANPWISPCSARIPISHPESLVVAWAPRLNVMLCAVRSVDVGVRAGECRPFSWIQATGFAGFGVLSLLWGATKRLCPKPCIPCMDAAVRRVASQRQKASKRHYIGFNEVARHGHFLSCSGRLRRLVPTWGVPWRWKACTQRSRFLALSQEASWNDKNKNKWPVSNR